MRSAIIAALALAALVVACDKPKTEAPPPPAPTPVATAPTPPAAPAPEPPAPALSGKMAHCPSTVSGAKTDLVDAPGGVAITVTSADPAATKEIRLRATFLSTSMHAAAAPVAHNGSGEGGGVFGRCPVVMRNTALEVSDVAGGSKIVVTPKDAKEQDWLRHESRARIAELETPGAAGAGVGKMAHCPNAVKGASTSVADKADAVQITVTAKDEIAVKAIRERAKQIVLASKIDSPTVKHDGSGNGGGGFGRCPIVLKDTAVESKEAPGGAIFMVKPKSAKDLPTLDKEVRARMAKFD